MWPVRRFPYLIFYLETEDRVDVWRPLHNRRDIPASLQRLD
jgi:toxin ParE1/3/4